MAELLTSLLSTSGSPPFIYLHHPHHPPSQAIPALPSRSLPVYLNGIEHHTPRLLYSGILHRLASRLGQKEDIGEVSTWDGFARALRDIWDTRPEGGGRMVNGNSGRKGKAKAKEGGLVNAHLSGLSNGIDGDEREEKQVVLVVTKADRLKNVLGPGWAVITRLEELTGVPSTVVLASQMPWDEIRPYRGDAPEPIHIYIPPLSREGVYLLPRRNSSVETLRLLIPACPHPLFPRFLDLLLVTLGPLLPQGSPVELLPLIEALWPIYTSSLPPHEEQIHLGIPYPDASNLPPPLTITVKLLTDLKAGLSLPIASAGETLLPMQCGIHEFISSFTSPSSDILGARKGPPKLPPLEIPLLAKYLVVAAYCASYNPAKSDLRLFGRGVGAGGKRKKGGGTRRAGYGRTRIGKVPQRLLGPKSFPLDRLLALFASIYGEHAPRPPQLENVESSSDEEDDFPAIQDSRASLVVQRRRADKRRKREEENAERWDEEVWGLTMSTKLFSLIPDLEGQGLLKRVSPVDRLDNVMLRCEVDYELTKTLARELKITLDEYLYEATM